MANALQFSLKRMLLATTWIAIGAAAYLLLYQLEQPRGWDPIDICLEGVGAFLIVASPFAAIGSLFGRTVAGLAVGLLVLLALLFVFAPVVD